MRAHFLPAAFLLACGRPEQPQDTKESPAPDSIDTGVDSPDPETATETDTGEPPDTQLPDETDSSFDTDTGSTTVACDSALPWRFVAAGVYQTCGIHTDGCAECWGRGKEQSGEHQSETGVYYWEGEDQPPPSAYESIVMFGSENAAKERYHACGLTELGEALCWGEDRYGETVTDTGAYVDLAIWKDGTFALDGSGVVKVWGEGVLPPEGEYVDIAVASYYGLALALDGSVETWDADWDHEIDNPYDPYLAVDIADDACGIKRDGTLRCWYPTSPNEEYPYAIATDVPNGAYTDLCVEGNGRACALDETGGVTCWGDSWSPYPDQPPEGETFTQIACGWYHACGVTQDQRIVCWGVDVYGETTPPS